MEDPSPSSSTTLSTISSNQHVHVPPPVSTPPLPSPPSSPLLGPVTDSIPPSPSSLSSGFPSGASSYMFSLSGVTSHNNSPPHIHYDLSLVIPSLTLPPPLPQLSTEQDNWRNQGTIRDKERTAVPTTIYGETLGRLDLLVFGRKGAGKTALANTLIDANNEDIVINDGWDRDRRVLSAATVATRHTSHQIYNVTITEVDGFDEEDSMVSSCRTPVARYTTLRRRADGVIIRRPQRSFSRCSPTSRGGSRRSAKDYPTREQARKPWTCCPVPVRHSTLPSYSYFPLVGHKEHNSHFVYLYCINFQRPHLWS